MGPSTQAPFTFQATLRACTHAEVRKLRNFHFLHHHQILHCLKAITDYRNVRAIVRALRARVHTYRLQILFGASLIHTQISY